MCGMIATLHTNPTDCQVEADMHEALFLLQHCGHDACGLATCAAGGKSTNTSETGLHRKCSCDGAQIADLHGYMWIAT